MLHRPIAPTSSTLVRRFLVRILSKEEEEEEERKNRSTVGKVDDSQANKVRPWFRQVTKLFNINFVGAVFLEILFLKGIMHSVVYDKLIKGHAVGYLCEWKCILAERCSLQ